MRPTPQFIQMIKTIFQNRTQSITQNDIRKHNTRAISYYSMSSGKVVNNQVVSNTEAFSEQIMIEIERGAYKVIVGTPTSNTIYSKTSPIDFNQLNGKGYIHWDAVDGTGKKFIIVKMLANDFTTQIKITTPDQQNYVIHNVCELPDLL